MWKRWRGLRSVRTRYPESLPWRRPSRISSLTRTEADERRTARRAVATGVMPWPLGLFLLGLLSKTAIVTLPLALLVVLWWKRGAISLRRDVVPLIPFFFLSAAAGLLTRWVEYGNNAYRARDLDFSFLERCLIAGRAFWFQL